MVVGLKSFNSVDAVQIYILSTKRSKSLRSHTRVKIVGRHLIKVYCESLPINKSFCLSADRSLLIETFLRSWSIQEKSSVVSSERRSQRDGRKRNQLAWLVAQYNSNGCHRIVYICAHKARDDTWGVESTNEPMGKPTRAHNKWPLWRPFWKIFSSTLDKEKCQRSVWRRSKQTLLCVCEENRRYKY